MEPSSGMTFDQVSACAQEVSAYLSDHVSWGDPILEPVPGCPDLIFNPAVFEEKEQEWICNGVNGNQLHNRKEVVDNSIGCYPYLDLLIIFISFLEA